MKLSIIFLTALLMAGQTHAQEQKLTVTCTAYCEKQNRTAAGTKVNTETIAVSHDLKRKLKWGTRIYIPSLKRYYKVLDLMAPRWRMKTDIWLPTKRECLRWGKRTVDIEILTALQ